MSSTINSKIESGSDILDELLEGGYETDAITTIYGPAGSGKTNLAIIAAINQARKGKKVIFVDTEGGFSIERFKQVCAEHEKILGRIIFVKPTSFEEQHKAIMRLKKIIKRSIGLIIVDTISMLYRFERRIGDPDQEFNRDLGMQIATLTEIARKKRIPVLLTNQVYTSFENNRANMVGGDILKYGSKCLVELQILRNGKRKAIIRKHRSIAGEKEAFFEIVRNGIRGFVLYNQNASNQNNENNRESHRGENQRGYDRMNRDFCSFNPTPRQNPQG